MIVDGILTLLLGAASLVFGILPDAEPLGLGGISSAVGVAVRLDAGLPISETLMMAAMCLAIISGIFVTRLLITIYHLIPGKFS